MYLVCKNALAGAALAGEENCRIAGGGALRLLQQSLHNSNVRFEQGSEVVRKARYRTIQTFAFFVQFQPRVWLFPMFEPDDLDANVLGAAQQVAVHGSSR